MGLARFLSKTFDRKPQLSPEDLRKAIPVRNPEAAVVSEDEDSLVIEAPLQQTSTGIIRLLAKSANAPAMKRFELETVGAFVWKSCDGINTFEGISKKLREKYKMQRVEADAALAAFLQTLAQRKLITLMVKGQK